MQFYVLKNDEQTGPFSLIDVRERLKKGEFAYSDLAWRDGLAEWTPLKDLMGGALPEATPHAVAAPSYSAPAKAPIAARAVTAAGLFIVLFGVLTVVFMFITFMCIGLFLTLHAPHGPSGLADQAQLDDSATHFGRTYGNLAGAAATMLAFLVSAFTAWKMAFSNLFPWCRKR
jgi:hypothetical protein